MANWQNKQVANVNKKDIKAQQIPIIAPHGSWQIDLTFYEQFKAVNKGKYVI